MRVLDPSEMLRVSGGVGDDYLMLLAISRMSAKQKERLGEAMFVAGASMIGAGLGAIPGAGMAYAISANPVVIVGGGVFGAIALATYTAYFMQGLMQPKGN